MKVDLQTCLEITLALFGMMMFASKASSMPSDFKGFLVLFTGISLSVLAGLNLYKILNWKDFE